MNKEKNMIHLGIYGICIQDNKLLLIKKNRGPYVGLLDLPGGKIEFSETFKQALNRELLEETGLDILQYTQLCIEEYQCKYISNGEDKEFHHIAIYNNIELGQGCIKSGSDGHDSDGACWVKIPIQKDRIAPIAHNVLRQAGLICG